MISSSSSSELNKKREIFLQRKKLNEGCSLSILAIWCRRGVRA